MIRVEFPARGLEGLFPPGTTLHEAVRMMGHVIDYACGGNALCGTCCVRIVEGDESLCRVEKDEAGRLREIEAGPRDRLACQARLAGGGSSAPGVVVVAAAP